MHFFYKRVGFDKYNLKINPVNTENIVRFQNTYNRKNILFLALWHKLMFCYCLSSINPICYIFFRFLYIITFSTVVLVACWCHIALVCQFNWNISRVLIWTSGKLTFECQKNAQTCLCKRKCQKLYIFFKQNCHWHFFVEKMSILASFFLNGTFWAIFFKWHVLGNFFTFKW